MGDEAKSLASEARRSRSERDADRLCRTESLQLIPTIKAWWWDSEKAESCFQPYKLQALQRTGTAGISIDHRGSSAPGDGAELTRLRAGPRPSLPIFVSRYKSILNIDKFLPKHYNIYKYNTKGKRRSAHHPKGGVAHVEVVRASFCFFRRNQVHNNNDTQKITALP